MTAGNLVRLRRALRACGALLVAWPVLVVGSAVAAPDPAPSATSLGGYSLLGRATAIRTLYDTPGSLPVGPLLEVTSPEAQASLATGPFGSALSSTLYPGPLVEGAPALLATLGAPTGDVPPYPVVVRASTSGPPEATDEPAPGTGMFARVDGTLAEARSTSGASAADPVLTAGGMRADAASLVEGDAAMATATTQVSDVVALGGLLVIESVRSSLESSSDASTGRSSGGTVVSGASFAGTPVTIDEDGISLVPEGDEAASPLSAVAGSAVDPDALLSELGISVRVAEPTERIDGATVTRMTEGLVISFDDEIGETPLDGPAAELPTAPIPGSPISGPADLVSLLTSRQVAEVSIGRVEVTAGASPGFELPSFEGPVPTTGPDPAPGPSSLGTGTAGGTVADSRPTLDAPAASETSQFLPAMSQPSPLGTLGPTTFVGLLVAATLGSLLLTAGTRKLPELALDGTVAAVDDCAAPAAREREDA